MVSDGGCCAHADNGGVEVDRTGIFHILDQHGLNLGDLRHFDCDLARADGR